MEFDKETLIKNFIEDIGGKGNFNFMRGKWHANRYQEGRLHHLEHFQDPEVAAELMRVLRDDKFFRKRNTFQLKDLLLIQFLMHLLYKNGILNSLRKLLTIG